MSGAVRAAVLTISDRCARGEAEDTSGPALAALARERLDAGAVECACVSDDVDAIRRQILAWAKNEPSIDLILTTGGTGLGPRDVTPEAIGPLLERPASGLMELARLRCLEKTPLTFLSRGVAGVIGRTLVVTFPGSRAGASEQFEALTDVLPHALHVLGGGGHEFA